MLRIGLCFCTIHFSKQISSHFFSQHPPQDLRTAEDQDHPPHQDHQGAPAPPLLPREGEDHRAGPPPPQGRLRGRIQGVRLEVLRPREPGGLPRLPAQRPLRSQRVQEARRRLEQPEEERGEEGVESGGGGGGCGGRGRGGGVSKGGSCSFVFVCSFTSAVIGILMPMCAIFYVDKFVLLLYELEMYLLANNETKCPSITSDKFL